MDSTLGSHFLSAGSRSSRRGPSPPPSPLSQSFLPQGALVYGAPCFFTGGSQDATPWHRAPILGRFLQEAPRFLPALQASASAQTPNGDSSDLGAHSCPPASPCPGPLSWAQVSGGTPGLGTPAFSRPLLDSSLAAQPSSSGVLRIPHLAGPLCPLVCPGPARRFLRVGSPLPPCSVLFLFDIFPLGVCGGMFLLVTCKELL